MDQRRTKDPRARGQGLTEYIIIVGLIGILLVMAVNAFKDQIQVTIEGSQDRLERDVTDGLPGGGGGGNIGGNGGNNMGPGGP